MGMSLSPFKREERMQQKYWLRECKSVYLKAANEFFIKQPKRRVGILSGSVFPIFCCPL